jgi:hypothetical protein
LKPLLGASLLVILLLVITAKIRIKTKTKMTRARMITTNHFSLTTQVYCSTLEYSTSH